MPPRHLPVCLAVGAPISPSLPRVLAQNRGVIPEGPPCLPGVHFQSGVSVLRRREPGTVNFRIEQGEGPSHWPPPWKMGRRKSLRQSQGSQNLGGKDGPARPGRHEGPHPAASEFWATWFWQVERNQFVMSALQTGAGEGAEGRPGLHMWVPCILITSGELQKRTLNHRQVTADESLNSPQVPEQPSWGLQDR